MFSFNSKGSFDNTERMLRRAIASDYSFLSKYAQEGVDALSAATPKNSGKTAASWYYKIVPLTNGVKIDYCNSNINQRVNIAIILQYGHGTGTGGYVQGRDYINPAVQPVFDKIAEEAWKEVTK